VANLSVLENLILPRMKDFRGKLGHLHRSSMRAAAYDLVKEFNIRPGNIDAPIRSLSGGNQQKVVLARWFSLGPKVAVLDEPFQGVDIGAKGEISSIITQAADLGMSFIIVDSDFANLSSLCDRVLILHDGLVREELTGDRARRTDEITTRVLLSHLNQPMEYSR
jgi:ribose transport system ATP-binding protein